jgi:hypothetical protein
MGLGPVHHRMAMAMAVALPPPCTCTYFHVLTRSPRSTRLVRPRFTFLATLFLLLFVSSAIILRSFILRRRFRQRIEEAILAGVIVPNPTGRVSRRRALGEKPKLWETYVFPADNDRWDSIVVRPFPLSLDDTNNADLILPFPFTCTLCHVPACAAPLSPPPPPFPPPVAGICPA